MLLVFSIRMSRSYDSPTSQATFIFRRFAKIVAVGKAFSIFGSRKWSRKWLGVKTTCKRFYLEGTCDLHNPVGIEVHRKPSDQWHTCTVHHSFSKLNIIFTPSSLTFSCAFVFPNCLLTSFQCNTLIAVFSLSSCSFFLLLLLFIFQLNLNCWHKCFKWEERTGVCLHKSFREW